MFNLYVYHDVYKENYIDQQHWRTQSLDYHAIYQSLLGRNALGSVTSIIRGEYHRENVWWTKRLG